MSWVKWPYSWATAVAGRRRRLVPQASGRTCLPASRLGEGEAHSPPTSPIVHAQWQATRCHYPPAAQLGARGELPGRCNLLGLLITCLVSFRQARSNRGPRISCLQKNSGTAASVWRPVHRQLQPLTEVELRVPDPRLLVYAGCQRGLPRPRQRSGLTARQNYSFRGSPRGQFPRQGSEPLPAAGFDWCPRKFWVIFASRSFAHESRRLYPAACRTTGQRLCDFHRPRLRRSIWTALETKARPGSPRSASGGARYTRWPAAST